MTVYRIAPAASGNLCTVGSTVDPESGTSQARILMVAPGARRVLWDKTVPAPEDMASSRYVACRADGKLTWVAANVDTNASPPLNQGLAYVYKFDGEGTLLEQRELDTDTRNAFVYDLDVDGEAVDVIGMASSGNEGSATNAIFLTRIEPGTKKPAVRKMATGAYAPGAAVRLTKGTALLGGSFYAATTTPQSLLDDYAVSKIVAGKYAFSVRPQHALPENVATAITAAEDIVSLGYKGTTSHLTVVNVAGKVIDDRTLKSAWCRTTSITANASTVYAVRENCTDENQVRLVALDRKSGAESLPEGVTGKPVHVIAVGTDVYVMSRKKDGALLLQSLPADAFAQAAPDTLELSNNAGALTRSITVSKWSVDKRGVPSFDYRFKLAGGDCNYERHGHAVAGFDDNGDGVELEMYHPQAANGKEGPPVTSYYDSADAKVNFEVSDLGRNKLLWLAITDKLMPKAMGLKCGLGGKTPSVTFKNK